MKTPRAVEALRIALGLGTGTNPLTIVLQDQAPLLLANETDDLEDAEILEKHRPVFKELGISFLVPPGAAARFDLNPDFNVREVPDTEAAAVISHADRVLVF
jgi:hypothetical protein